MEAYTILAKYYDVLMKDFDYDGYLNFVKEYTKGEGIDLCCGSGSMTLRLAKLGNKMLGVDISGDMLNEARNKSRAAGKNIMYIQESVVDFVPPHKVDFVTCVCDGFNYISEDQLSKVIKKVATYVKQNGYFVFDYSSEYKLKNVLGNNVFCEDTNKATYIWSNELKDNCVDMQISFFENQKGDLYKRIDENHKQFIHNTEKTTNLLNKDFNVMTVDGTTYKELREDSRRVLFVCKRK